jgi:hypothetical protein
MGELSTARRGYRRERDLTLTVPPPPPGSRLDLPHWDWTEHLLVLEVHGQRVRVCRWSWWRDRFTPRLYRLLHPELW